MNTAGAALQIMDRSTKKGTTTMNQLADTIRITFKQQIDGFGHGLLKSHANIPVRLISSTRWPREHPRDHVQISHSILFLSAMSVNGLYPLFLYELDDSPSCYAYRSRMYISLDTSVRLLWQYRRYGAGGRQQYQLCLSRTCYGHLVPRAKSPRFPPDNRIMIYFTCT